MLLAAFDCNPNASDPRMCGFKGFVKKCGDFSSRRNEVAHGVVTKITSDGALLGHYCCAAAYNTRKNLSRADFHAAMSAYLLEGAEGSAPWDWRYSYTAAQINQYAEGFMGLRERAYQYETALREIAEEGSARRDGAF